MKKINKHTQTTKNNQKYELGGFGADFFCNVTQIKIAVDLILFSYLLTKSPSFRQLKNTFVEMLLCNHGVSSAVSVPGPNLVFFSQE